MEKIRIKKLHPNAVIPTYGSLEAAGADIYACLEAAVKLADFLMGIQCTGESHLWDGAWRGAYNVRKGCWSGRANQNNDIDEGGMYSVYTGWCNTTIMQGLLELERLL